MINQQLKTQLLQLHKPSFWEMQARQKLGYMKKGEVVYKFVPDTPSGNN